MTEQKQGRGSGISIFFRLISTFAGMFDGLGNERSNGLGMIMCPGCRQQIWIHI